MYAGPFYMLHYARDEDVLSIGYGVHFYLLALYILVDEYRMLRRK